MANIPEDLFDRLLENGPPGSRQLALIGALFTGGAAVEDEIERCPHCRGVLRTRAGISPEATAIISDWLDEQSPSAPTVNPTDNPETVAVSTRETSDADLMNAEGP
jgi:hypothetical protein